MARDYRDYVASAFGPFVAAAGNPAYVDQLKTADVPKERRKEQFAKFKSLELRGGEPLYLPGNGFAARFRHSAGDFIAISDHHLDEEGREALIDWAVGEELQESSMDEATFLVLSGDFSAFYKPKGDNLKSERSDNLLNIFHSEYKGHDLFDIMDWFQSVAIFDIPKDHYMRNCSTFKIAASVVVGNAAFRPDILDGSLAAALADLNKISNLNPENIYFASTSTHWKHTFIELYKCLEAIFYLPWTSILRDSLKSELSALSLAKECRKSLVWREKEKVSIARIFEMLPDEICRPQELAEVTPLRDLFGNGAAAARFGERVYKIRNQLVHQEDYEDPVQIEIGNAWLPICLYLANVVKHLYVTHATDIDYSYAEEPLAAGELTGS